MAGKELLSILATLATIMAGLVAVLEHTETDTSAVVIPPAPQPSEPKIIVLARTAYNDSGNAYVERFDGGVIPLNGSVQVIYITR